MIVHAQGGVSQQLLHAILRSTRMTCQSPPIKHQNRGLRLEDLQPPIFRETNKRWPHAGNSLLGQTHSMIGRNAATCKHVVQPSNNVVVVVTVFCLKAQVFASKAPRPLGSVLAGVDCSKLSVNARMPRKSAWREARSRSIWLHWKYPEENRNKRPTHKVG